LILAVFTKTPPVFFALPLSSPSVQIFVTLFVQPTCSTLVLFFLLIEFLAVKSQTQRAAPTPKTKRPTKNLTPKLR